MKEWHADEHSTLLTRTTETGTDTDADAETPPTTTTTMNALRNTIRINNRYSSLRVCVSAPSTSTSSTSTRTSTSTSMIEATTLASRDDDDYNDDNNTTTNNSNSNNSNSNNNQPANIDIDIDIEEAIDRLGMGLFQYQVVLACGLCFASDAMEILLLGFLTAMLKGQWGLSERQTDSIVSVVFAGALLGTLLLTPLGDKWGRRPVFAIVASTISAFGMLTAVCHTYPQLLLARFVVGIGVGGLTVPYDALGEFMPATFRGPNVLSTSFFWTTSSLAVPLVAWLTLGHQGINSGSNSNSSNVVVVGTVFDAHRQGYRFFQDLAFHVYQLVFDEDHQGRKDLGELSKSNLHNQQLEGKAYVNVSVPGRPPFPQKSGYQQAIHDRLDDRQHLDDDQDDRDAHHQRQPVPVQKCRQEDPLGSGVLQQRVPGIGTEPRVEDGVLVVPHGLHLGGIVPAQPIEGRERDPLVGVCQIDGDHQFRARFRLVADQTVARVLFGAQGAVPVGGLRRRCPVGGCDVLNGGKGQPSLG
mmetsp:Transcript_5137/g.11385  ORF Transcript_5137/g.11385 Transcript_5137/m.11385 type:complete len:527 (+) Transcript_5137:288-1868(+)